MTFFNAAGVLMGLGRFPLCQFRFILQINSFLVDEYYDKCVEIKPRIPPRYSSSNDRKRKNRQAGHLRSYKDLDCPLEDDEDEEDEGTDLERNFDGSNVSQIDYEINDFNKMYCEKEGQMQGISPSSAQWRIHANNVNRPPGAPPLVPSASYSRDNVKNRLDLRTESRGFRRPNQRNRNNQNKRNNQNNRPRNNRLGNGFHRVIHKAPMEQRMRNSYNAFNSSHNDTQQSGDVLMNTNNHFQNIQQRPYELNTTNRMYSDNNGPMGMNSITSLINSVSKIPDDRVKNRNKESLFNNGFEGAVEVRPRQNGEILLGDLIGMNPNEDSNFNVSDVARNVLLLLKSVAQKPTEENSFDFQVK
ncbi:hypothetical protein KR009_002374 [Drosophila setifemur]|nr:hypothetical protein KR009_002374 [Drosophila setifemur]